MPKNKARVGAGDLILNAPFAEPSKYWSYDRKHMIFTQIDGRRPAGYIVATPDAQGFNDPGQFIELDLVNQIRPRVKAWREANYPGATGITRRLLEHWHDPNHCLGRIGWKPGTIGRRPGILCPRIDHRCQSNGDGSPDQVRF